MIRGHVHFADEKSGSGLHRRASTGNTPSNNGFDIERFRRLHPHTASTSAVPLASSAAASKDRLGVPTPTVNGASTVRPAMLASFRADFVDARSRARQQQSESDLPIRPHSAGSPSNPRLASSTSTPLLKRSPPGEPGLSVPPSALRHTSSSLNINGDGGMAPRASSLAPPPPPGSRLGKRRASSAAATPSLPPIVGSPSGVAGAPGGSSPSGVEGRITARGASEILFETLSAYDCSLEEKLRVLRQIAIEVQDDLIACYSTPPNGRERPSLAPLHAGSATSASSITSSSTAPHVHHRTHSSASHHAPHHHPVPHSFTHGPQHSHAHHAPGGGGGATMPQPIDDAVKAVQDANKARKAAMQNLQRVIESRERS